MPGLRAPLRAAAIALIGGVAWLLAPAVAHADSLPPVTVPPVTLPPVTLPTVPLPTVPALPPATVPTLPPVTTPAVDVAPPTSATAILAGTPSTTTTAPVTSDGAPDTRSDPNRASSDPRRAPPPTPRQPLTRVAASSARDLSVPVALALIVGAFLMLSPGSARSDAKLTAAPVSTDDELVGFS